MIKKLIIGIDPSLTKLNAAIITGDKQVLAVFMRRNKSQMTNDQKVVAAARCAFNLGHDLINFITGFARGLGEGCTLSIVVESQSMEDARKRREKGQKVRYEDIRKLSQATGAILGCLSGLTDKITLVQPSIWKGTLDKTIAHPRYYGHLGLVPDIERRVACIYPTNMAELIKYSQEKINMGDFWDINDSLGLALYGVTKKL